MDYGEHHRQKMAEKYEHEWRALNRVDRRRKHRAVAALLLAAVILLTAAVMIELFK